MSQGDEDTRTVARKVQAQQGPGERDRPCFIVIRGLNVGEMYKLARNEMVVGRGQHADIEILDDGISRRHARIVHKEGKFFVAEEIGTMNGTFLNNQKLATGVLTPIKDGDEFTLCRLTLTFRLPAAK